MIRQVPIEQCAAEQETDEARGIRRKHPRDSQPLGMSDTSRMSMV